MNRSGSKRQIVASFVRAVTSHRDSSSECLFLFRGSMTPVQASANTAHILAARLGMSSTALLTRPAPVLGKRKKSLSYFLSNPAVSFKHPPSPDSEVENSDSEWGSDYESEATATEESSAEESDAGNSLEHVKTGVASRNPSSSSLTKLARPRARKYFCVHENCDKSYTKPSRLAEHERSHTGVVSNVSFCWSIPSLTDEYPLM